ncbi:protein FAM151B isoform X2 [Musca domestica]|uniref:Protein FAM151B isoform X2 n=1 Tax=Musca domestica TaxID=7370 RepID=A0A9J7DLF8_MUSDO|nr:protein FAM151B isoform X2 [Musca domestica]
MKSKLDYTSEMLRLKPLNGFPPLLHSLNAATTVKFPKLVNETAEASNVSRYEYTVDGRAATASRLGAAGKDIATHLNMSTRSGESATNLTALTWAHAVNSQKELTDALQSDIDMIEADIVMGKINNTGPDMPVMAHPPANSSDISLDSFLQQIKIYNDENAEKMKGVKLDFKSIEVFEGALKTLEAKIPEMTYPIWLNADIISGPVNQNNTIPVDPQRFFAGSSQFPQAVLSIGWTTRWSSDYNNGSYTHQEIDAMVVAIRTNNVTETGQPITFPVRAGIAANSQEELHHLVKAVNGTNNSTLTIWSSQNDYVDVAKLRELIFSFGFDRVYLDVPEELSSQLNLGRTENGGGGNDGNGGSGNGAATSSPALTSLVNFSLISAGLYLFSLYWDKIRL